jgi:hypothetical protein
MAFQRDLTKGVLDDLRQGLQNGESFWKAFGNAALNVLNKIIDKIENELLDAIFKANSAGGGGGGIFGSILSGIGSLFGFGGSTYGSYGPGVTGDPWAGMRFANGTDSAPGGLSLVGERGPEIMQVPRGARIMSNERLARALNSGSGGGQNVHVTVGVSVDQNGNLQAYVKNVSQSEAAQAVSAFSTKALPRRLKAINADPRAVG